MTLDTKTESAIRIRRVEIEFLPDIDPVVIEGCPEESYTYVAASLLLPYLEPYLIRSMRAAKEHIDDPKVRADLEAFNGQEGQHYRQHIRFNKAMRLHGFTGLEELEAELDADYRRYTESKSLRFNLAYAEGFEAYTAAFGRFLFESDTFERMQPAARELFSWHFVEELEHRTVTFDVYKAVCGGYFYRLFVGFFAQWHLNQFITRVSRRMVSSDRDEFRRRFGGNAEARARTWRIVWAAVKGLLPKVLATYLPWYTPHRIEMPPEAKAVAERYGVSADAPPASTATAR